jgi:hypothetical protein
MEAANEHPARRLAQQVLDPGETLVWADFPNPAAHARRGLATSAFGLVFLSFALFWEYGVITSGAPLVMPLFGLIFVVTGAALVLSPLWMQRKATRTVYAVTDRRLLTLTLGRFGKVRSYAPEDLGPILQSEGKQGYGDVIFRRETYRVRHRPHPRHGPSRYRTRSRRIGFFGIRHSARVAAAVRALKAGRDPSDEDGEAPTGG